jgi:hypothetical protein
MSRNNRDVVGFHQGHELLLALEKAGLTSDDAQCVVDWPDNAMAHEIVATMKLVQLYTAGMVEHVASELRAGATAEQIADKFFRSPHLAANVRFRQADPPDPAVLKASGERWGDYFVPDAAVWRHRQNSDVWVGTNFPSLNVGPRGYEPGAYVVKLEGWYGPDAAIFHDPDHAFRFAHAMAKHKVMLSS